ncbi:hypothetical protein [Tychonema sp. LEGE 07203]|uniref:hypothetical protein n=1 Tax=Tychonema sp. LEGE 07203 TaxID=1828671 RepID=UPI0019E1216F|nr:hypothetical protein [Tychonema sp. LEGE 07203]MBE9094743.1 hypothetical protein [Tychonema sp. LEGE 07203]
MTRFYDSDAAGKDITGDRECVYAGLGFLKIELLNPHLTPQLSRVLKAAGGKQQVCGKTSP